jgi:uncharacterized protein YcbX
MEEWWKKYLPFVGTGLLAVLLWIVVRRLFAPPKKISAASASRPAPQVATPTATPAAPPVKAAAPAAKATTATSGEGHAPDADYVDYAAAAPGSGTRLVAIFVYPVKSCGGVSLAKSVFNKFGLKFDREWMVVDAESGDFLTQRQAPALATVRVAFDNMESAALSKELILAAPGRDELRVPVFGPKDRPKDRPVRPVRVWNYQGPAEDEGDTAAAWFSAVVGRPVRLVRMPEKHARAVESGMEVQGAQNVVSFVDGFPLLVTTCASVDDIAARAGFRVAATRFRPNLLIATSDGTPFAEDRWAEITIGKNNIPLVAAKDCDRCKIPTINQLTGEADGDRVSKALHEFRSRSGDVLFGVNMVHRNERGLVSVGDAVTVQSQRDAPKFD